MQTIDYISHFMQAKIKGENTSVILLQQACTIFFVCLSYVYIALIHHCVHSSYSLQINDIVFHIKQKTANSSLIEMEYVL